MSILNAFQRYQGVICLAIVAMLCCSGAVAQANQDKIIKEVRIQGLERVSDQVVRAKLEVQPDQKFNNRAVARDIRRIYDFGFFSLVKADATLDGDQLILTYIVEEKRIIDRLNLLGNKKIKDRKIREVLSLREGEFFAEEAVNEEQRAILEIYQSKGYAMASVDITVQKIGTGRVQVNYNISENEKARIRSVRFDGNDAISKRKLRKTIKTKRAWWFMGGKYEETKFENDLTMILDEYGNRGRLEAAIPKTDLTYAKNGKKMDIVIYLEEGPEYRVDTLETDGNQVFDNEEALGEVKVLHGNVHNKGQVAKDGAAIQQMYQDNGYIQANVEPVVTLDRDKKTTHVVHKVREGDLKYIKEITVLGNQTTKDEIIRRQLRMEPGDRYDGTALQASERRLDNTQYFETARIYAEPLEEDDLFTNMMIDVEEAKTGNFVFGAGYSTDEGVGGFTELRLDNFDLLKWPDFAGGGQRLRLRLAKGDRRDQYSLSFTDPELMGYPLSFGFDVFDESFSIRGGANYREEITGGQLRLGKVLSPTLTIRASLRYQETVVTDLPLFSNPRLNIFFGKNEVMSTKLELERNTLDRYRDPSSGSRHTIALEVAGYAAESEYLKFTHDSIWHRALDEDKKWVLSFRIREGLGTTYGSTDFIPLQERFYAGGTTTVRGYENRDIGPKIRESWFWGDTFAVGGEMRVISNLELKYKLTDMLRLYSFLDGGGVWSEVGDFDTGDLRYSVGVGLGFDIPRMGPVRVDYGIPLNPDSDQGSGRLHIMSGFFF